MQMYDTFGRTKHKDKELNESSACKGMTPLYALSINIKKQTNQVAQLMRNTTVLRYILKTKPKKAFKSCHRSISVIVTFLGEMTKTIKNKPKQ